MTNQIHQKLYRKTLQNRVTIFNPNIYTLLFILLSIGTLIKSGGVKLVDKRKEFTNFIKYISCLFLILILTLLYL